MTLFVLDTDILSLHQRGDANVGRHIDSAGTGNVAITVISVDEQIAGRYSRLRAARTPEETERSYRLLAETVGSLGVLPILPFTVAAIARFHQLRRLRLNVGTNDLRIAAIVLEGRGTLVTRNAVDFRRIPELTIADWSV